MVICGSSNVPFVSTSLTWLSARYTTGFATALRGTFASVSPAYTILLELERILKAAKSDITIHRAQELTKNMYAISYIHVRSKQAVKRILGMDEEQRKLYALVDMATQS